ncbi:hypothetical protein UPYG_G00225140 [Umbra pygmaea]|uniref:DUF5641 domain-containing protein n=1 Tax=Umbra pygmaea TaxID=75934 RepID=A0ABD0WWQ8_UMBPY
MGGAGERMIGVARRILDSMLLQGPLHLSHEVLCTFMAEVTAIINARPLVPVSTDPDSPLILTPAMLLTQKYGAPLTPPGDFTDKDLFRRQWRQVQSLQQVLVPLEIGIPTTLQSDRSGMLRHLQTGDLVLLKDSQVPCNEWPLALVSSAMPGCDGKYLVQALPFHSFSFVTLYESTINQEQGGYFLTLVSSVIGVWLAV